MSNTFFQGGDFFQGGFASLVIPLIMGLVALAVIAFFQSLPKKCDHWWVSDQILI